MVKRFYSFALMCVMLMVATAASAINVVADPASGSVVTQLNQVTVTFVGVEYADQSADGPKVTISNGAEVTDCTLGYGATDNMMIIECGSITADGVYTITAPAGAFELDGEASEAFTLTYTIGEGGVDPNLSLSPANGATVGWLSRIIYRYSTAASRLNYNSQAVVTATHEDGDVVTGSSVYDYTLANGEGAIDLKSVITKPGLWSVDIPRGTFTVSVSGYDENGNYFYRTDTLPGTTVQYNVTGEGLDVPVVTPSENIYKLQTFTLTFPNETSIAFGKPTSYINIYRDNYQYSAAGFTMNQGVIDGNSVTWTLYSGQTTPDHYYFSLPEGALLFGEDQRVSSPMSVEFNVVEAPVPTYVMTPAVDEEVTSLKDFVITFPEKQTLTVTPSTGVTLYKRDGSAYGKVIGSAYQWQGNIAKVEGQDNAAVIKLDAIATEPGEYELRLNVNTFTFEDGTFNKADTIVYVIVPNASNAAEFVVDPEEGTTLAKIQNFTITFPNAQNVEFTQGLNASNNKIKLVQGYTTFGEAAEASGITRVEGTTNAFEVKLSGAATLAGAYSLIIPSGMFCADGDVYSVTDTLTYYADGTGLDKIEVYPSMDEPIAEFPEAITITYVDETAVSLANSYPYTSLYRVNPAASYNTSVVSIGSANWSVEGNTVTLKLVDYQGNRIVVDTDGEYYMDIQANTLFLSDGETKSTPQHLTWIIDQATGIKNVDSTKKNAAMYDLMGRKVDENYKGIVIMNGKKYVK